MAHPFFRMVYYTLRIRLIQGGGIVATKRSADIGLTLLAVAIVLVIWIGHGASWTTGVGATSTAAPSGSISAIGGSIGFVELLVVVAAGLAVCFAVAACVVLVMKKRDKPK